MYRRSFSLDGRPAGGPFEGLVLAFPVAELDVGLGQVEVGDRELRIEGDRFFERALGLGAEEPLDLVAAAEVGPVGLEEEVVTSAIFGRAFSIFRTSSPRPRRMARLISSICVLRMLEGPSPLAWAVLSERLVDASSTLTS